MQCYVQASVTVDIIGWCVG